MNKTVFIALGFLLAAALGIAAYSLGVLAGGAADLHGTGLENPPSVADVSLVDASGSPVTISGFEGDYLLVFFGYTNCPDVCPLTMARLGSVYRALGEPEGLQVAMVTVDPENDSPATVDAYARRFHPDFTGLGGTRAQVDAAASRFYISHRDDGRGLVIHGSQVLLVDPQGRFQRVYNDEAQIHLEEDLRRLLPRS